MKLKDIIIPLVLSVTLIGSGLGIVSYLVRTRPKAETSEPEVVVPLVEVTRVLKKPEPILLKVLGTVLPTRELIVEPEIVGRVIWTSPQLVPGGRFKKGEVILRLDRKDLETVVVERQSQLARANLELELEKGRAEIAKREWLLLNKRKGSSAKAKALTLRKPQLENAQSAVDAAKASLEQAHRDLTKTVVCAPFEAIVQSEQAEIGQRAHPQRSIATLVGAEKYFVRVSLPIKLISKVTLPDRSGRHGARARVLLSPEGKNQSPVEGRVVRLLRDLDEGGLMARLLVEISEREGGLGARPLLIRSLVDVVIEGRPIKNGVSIPRVALRENGTVWTVDKDSRLKFVEVAVLWKTNTRVVVDDGLPADSQVITSRLSGAVEGMRVRTIAANEGGRS